MKTHDLHYQLIASDPKSHVFTSVIHIKHAHDKQEIWLPNWIPGSYKIRDFCKFIISVSAKANGKPVPMTQLAKNRWRVESPAAELIITASIYGWDISVRGCHFDQTHGFFNGTHAFFAVEGQENNPCSVELIPPDEHLHWKCATAMTPLKVHRDGFGIYQAENYDELIDHPIEMGLIELIEFKAQGIPHQLVLTGVYEIDKDKLKQDLEKLCSEHIRLFGEFPASHYKILCHVMGKAFNGLEHRASAKIVISRKNMPYPGMPDNGEDYATFLSLVSHEYFHTWNVKRIKPEAFMPYQLEQECYTRQLWICEGFTSYYEDLLLVRVGLITPELFLQMFAEKMTSLLNGPGHLVQSVTDSSFCAWDKFYDPNENTPNTVVSYYTKGAVIAFMIDSYLRENTVFSLDDIMRLLWKDFGKVQKGVPEGWLENYLNEISEDGLKPLLHAWLHEASELPIEEYASAFGLEFIYEVKDHETSVELGIKTDQDNTITVCYTNGAAQKAGLSALDKLVAIDGISAASEKIDVLLRTFRPGDKITVHAFRRDELMQFEVILQPKLPREVKLKLADVQGEALKRRNMWLSI
jgi:predicted metalloprotease with PDZ domain